MLERTSSGLLLELRPTVLLSRFDRPQKLVRIKHERSGGGLRTTLDAAPSLLLRSQQIPIFLIPPPNRRIALTKRRRSKHQVSRATREAIHLASFGASESKWSNNGGDSPRVLSERGLVVSVGLVSFEGRVLRVNRGSGARPGAFLAESVGMRLADVVSAQVGKGGLVEDARGGIRQARGSRRGRGLVEMERGRDGSLGGGVVRTLEAFEICGLEVVGQGRKGNSSGSFFVDIRFGGPRIDWARFERGSLRTGESRLGRKIVGRRRFGSRSGHFWLRLGLSFRRIRFVGIPRACSSMWPPLLGDVGGEILLVDALYRTERNRPVVRHLPRK